MEDHLPDGAARPVHPAPRPAPEPVPAERVPEEAGRGRRRPGRRILLGGLVAALAAAGLLAWWLVARGTEGTDDAQVDSDIVAVSARVAGSVVAVQVSDNQPVGAGQVLLELDPTDLEVEVAQARAAVAQAQAQIASEAPSVSITQVTNRALLEQARAEEANARSAVEAARRALDEARANDRLARSNLARARSLLAGDSIARADFDRRVTEEEVAVAAVSSAEKMLQGRQAQLRSAGARVEQVSRNAPGQLVSSEATVEARRANLALAQARLHQAELDLGYARVAAPAAGIVGRKSVHPGERIQVGQQLLALTRTDDLWVTANFRETQVRQMRAGQPARIHVDALGQDFRGRVESFGGATGSRYSLLPPENATGNYVKVVQRLPVRIRFDPGQPGLERLRPGMSVEPSVSVR